MSKTATTTTAAPTGNKKACELCGLPIIARPVKHRFCCEGCARVWEVATEVGLTGILAQADAGGRASARKSQVARAAGSRRTIFRVDGMWCASCALILERAMLGIDGVLDAEVSFASGLARVTYSPDKATSDDLWRRVELLGYRPEKASGMPEANSAEAGDLFVKLFAGVAATMWVMWMSIFLLYPAYMRADYSSVRGPALLAGILTTFVLLYPGSVFVKGAWQAARVWRITMDTLVFIGTWSAYLAGIWSLATGESPGYFDSAAMITVVVLFGRWLETLARQKSSEAVSSMLDKGEIGVWVSRADGGVDKRKLDEVRQGDLVIVRAGERINVDGVIKNGFAAIDQSSLTGESLPVEKGSGDEVWAGTFNISGSLTIEAARPYSETLLARMSDLVEDAMFAKTNLQRWADLIAALFGPVVLTTAAATAVIGAVSGLSLSEISERAVAVLVVACPCAVSLATPLVAVNAIGRLASSGLLVRSADVLERAGNVTVMGLDKTGTITQGEASVVDVIVAEPVHTAGNLEALHPLRIAAVLEMNTTHPLADAIIRAAKERLGDDPVELQASDIRVLPGLGITGHIGTGTPAMVGNKRLLEKERAEVPDRLLQYAIGAEGAGNTIAWVAVNGLATGILVLSDKARPEASGVIRELKSLAVRAVMISGDTHGACKAVATRTGIDDFRAQVLPHEKEQLIRELRNEKGRTAFVGDGMNDAAALAASDLAIALSSGAQISVEAADIIITDQAKNPLSMLPIIVRTARKAHKLILQNFGWALTYNLIALPLAVSGLLNPIWAAVAMAVSSLAVVVNSLRIKQRLAGAKSPIP